MEKLPEIPADATAVKYFFPKEFFDKEKSEHIRKFDSKDPGWVEKKRESILAPDKAGNAYGIKFIGKSATHDRLYAKNSTIYIINWDVIDFRKAPWIAGMSASDFTKGKKHDFIIQAIVKDRDEKDVIKFAPYDENNMILVEHNNSTLVKEKIRTNTINAVADNLNDTTSV